MKYTLNLLRKEDKVAIITCKEPRIDMTVVNDEVGQICAEFDREHETVLLEPEPQQSIYKCIQKYLIEESNKDNYVDFVAIGNAGMNFSSNRPADYLGSVASMILKAKRMNVIFCP